MAIVIAVDGTAASGKGTLARGVAQKFGLDYLDTGSLYRAVGWSVLQNGGDPKNKADAVHAAETLDISAVDDALLRFDEIGRAAASVAAMQEVRLLLLGLQRRFAASPPHGKGAVLDGRDIGTVIVPGADVKFYITAKVEVRARRRYLEYFARDPSVKEEKILRDLIERDRLDTVRAISPMRPADDAVQIDTSDMSAEDALEMACRIIREKIRPSAL